MSGIEKSDPIKMLIAFFLPPLAVFMEVGLGGQFWLNILLCLMCGVPGIIHAFFVIMKR